MSHSITGRKKHCSEMKGDVGMALHEKRGEIKDWARSIIIITPSLHLCPHFLHYTVTKEQLILNWEKEVGMGL